jgi:hypothetical protein
MGSNSFGHRKILSAREQHARMLGTCPTFRSCIEKGALVAVGEVRPTSGSVVYTVRIEYRAGDAPEVTVLSPKLVPREEGGRLPHVYPGDKLCLYTPNTGQWAPDMSLPHTIVPWISEWLFYYEVWHVTGEWLGDGTEPAPKETIRNEKEKSYERT